MDTLLANQCDRAALRRRPPGVATLFDQDRERLRHIVELRWTRGLEPGSATRLLPRTRSSTSATSKTSYRSLFTRCSHWLDTGEESRLAQAAWGSPAEPRNPNLMIGNTVGHYRITARLGAGGMGEVFLAEDTRLDRKAAIKFLPADLADDPDRRQRFLTEAKAASALNHPHVCVVYDVGETEDGLPFIAMEFVEGQSLGDLVKQGPLEISSVVAIAVQVADALDAAHSRRIVHRDIKPENISLNERGEVKVLDFGLAKRMLQESADSLGTTAAVQQTQEGHVLGTPRYMSPEQALGKAVDHRSDLFSLGSVIYFLLTGRPPFAGANLGEVLDNVVHKQPEAIARFNYDVPPELERITLKLLAKQVDRRYQSARDLLVDLKNLLRDLDDMRAPRTRPWRPRPVRKRSPRAIS